MSDGLNRVTLIGRLGGDPELRHTQGGQAVLNISLACSESWFDKASNQRKERVEWVPVVIWGARAEGLAKVLGKGDLICVEGSLRTEEYVDRDGAKRKTTKVQASNVVLCGGSKRQGGSAGRQQAPDTDMGNGGNQVDDDDQIPF